MEEFDSDGSNEDEAVRLAIAAHADVIPEDRTVGFYFHSDAPAAIGGGLGQFLWFDMYEEMFEFLAVYSTAISSGPVYLDHEAIRQCAESVLDDYRTGSLEPSAAFQRLNETLRGFVKFEWFGAYSELPGGAGEFEKRVRTSFYEEQGAPEGIQ